MSTPKEPIREVIQVTRLTDHAYRTLEKKLPTPYADNETSPISAGYRLGVQAVLKELREGYVIDY